MTPFTRGAFWGIFAVILGISGCALQGTIVDVSDQQTRVDHVHLREHETLTIFDGSGMRQVPLSAIQQLSISAQNSRVIDGRLYYPANITFHSGGQVLGSKRSDVFDDDGAYVCVADEVCGENDNGQICVPLDRVSAIRIPK